MLQSKSFWRTLACAGVALFPIAAASAPADPFPPPGLYRVDSDGAMNMSGTTARIAGNGATGAGVIEGRTGNQAVQRRVTPATGQVTMCMPARPVNGGLPLPNSSCRAGAPVSGPDSTTFTAACGFLNTTTVVRKLNPKTWEYRTTSVEKLGGAALPDFAMQRRMFEQSARNAPTAEERADAAGVLANWAQYVAEARENAAEEANLSPSGRTQAERRSTLVTRLTRIGETCTR